MNESQIVKLSWIDFYEAPAWLSEGEAPEWVSGGDRRPLWPALRTPELFDEETAQPVAA